MRRKIKIKDQQLKDLVDKKYEILKEGKANAKKAEKLRQRNLELEKQLKPVKEKSLEKMAEAEKDIDLGEYEVLLTTEKEKGQYYLVIEDHLKVFKEQFKKQKEQEYDQQGTDKKDTSK